MKRGSSILWIMFLLAALVLGPAMISRRSAIAVEPPTSLSEQIAQERLLDAPANIKGSVPVAAPTSSDDSSVLE